MNRIRHVFYLGKSMQAAALAVVALALYVGLTEVQIVKELTMMCIGVGIFLAGKGVERLGNGRA